MFVNFFNANQSGFYLAQVSFRRIVGEILGSVAHKLGIALK